MNISTGDMEIMKQICQDTYTEGDRTQTEDWAIELYKKCLLKKDYINMFGQKCIIYKDGTHFECHIRIIYDNNTESSGYSSRLWTISCAVGNIDIGPFLNNLNNSRKRCMFEKIVIVDDEEQSFDTKLKEQQILFDKQLKEQQILFDTKLKKIIQLFESESDENLKLYDEIYSIIDEKNVIKKHFIKKEIIESDNCYVCSDKSKINQYNTSFCSVDCSKTFKKLNIIENNSHIIDGWRR